MEDRKLVPCDPVPEDCLSIKKIDKDHAQISVYSVQTNGHNCGVSGIAERVGDKLVYTEQGELEHGQQFAIILSGQTLTFKYLATPGTMIPPFCGARASLERVEFSLNKKQPIGAKECDQ
jgi:hypothetical protein